MKTEVEVKVKVQIDGGFCADECWRGRVQTFRANKRWHNLCAVWRENVAPTQDGEGWLRCPSCVRATERAQDVVY